jgi:voltage-gated potassium channel
MSCSGAGMRRRQRSASVWRRGFRELLGDLETIRKNVLYPKAHIMDLAMNEDLKARIYGILEPGDEDSKYFDPFIMGLIILNVVAVVLETVDWIYALFGPVFYAFDLFSIAVFSVEYLLRLWSCTENQMYRDPVSGRLRFMVTPMALVDLLAVLPFYLPSVQSDLRIMRAMRLFRLFRVLKLARYSESLQTFIDVLRLKKEELVLMFFAILILLVISSTLVYEAEHEAQPDAFASIPAAMWWGIVTLATVGYGDVYPETELGKLIGSIVVILGIGLFALPTGVLASGFTEVLARKKEKHKMKELRCPHCGRYIGDLAPSRRSCEDGGGLDRAPSPGIESRAGASGARESSGMMQTEEDGERGQEY